MKAVIQRVLDASIVVNDKTVAQIDSGLLIYFGVCKGDDQSKLATMVKKIVNMRLFNDQEGKMNLSVKDLNKEILVVSQFTLCANLNKGNRPSFDTAEDPQKAIELYKEFIKLLKNEKVEVSSSSACFIEMIISIK